MSSFDARRARRQQRAALGSCILAALACSGAVTLQALVTFVLPACLLVGILALRLTRRSTGMVGAALSSLVALGLAELTNVFSGDTSGPVARATFLCAAFTGITMAAAATVSPRFVLGGVVGILASALWLGAANEVRFVLAAVVLSLALLLPSFTRMERHESGPGRRLVVPLLAIITAGAAIGGHYLQAALQTDPPTAFAVAQVEDEIVPPRVGPDAYAPAARNAVTTDTPFTNSSGLSQSAADLVSWSFLVTACSVLLLMLPLRMLFVRWRWWQLRRQLQRGDAVASVLGAWHWMLIRLRSCGVHVPSALTPDGLGPKCFSLDVAPDVKAHVSTLGATATAAGFAAGFAATDQDAANAWFVSQAAVDAHRRTMRRHHRILAALR